MKEAEVMNVYDLRTEAFFVARSWKESWAGPKGRKEGRNDGFEINVRLDGREGGSSWMPQALK